MDLSEPDVFSAVYREFRRHVWSSAWRVVRDRELADDVTQEVFAWLWTHPRAYDGRSPLSAYLALLARTRAIDAWRSADARRRLGERLRREAPAPHHEPPDHDDVRAIVARLAPLHREALALAYWADLPLATIARRLGIPESTAKSRLRLARAQVARRLPTAA